MILYMGGLGKSREEAVIIRGALDEIEGVNSEYNWLEQNFGEENLEWEMLGQELIDEGDRQYDILRIKFLNGEVKEFWFDITEFYGE